MDSAEFEIYTNDKPGKPSPPTITVSDDNLNAVVTWTDPEADGGTPITGYVVEIKDSDGDF